MRGNARLSLRDPVNLDIRALRTELTQADADILTAGLCTNPLVSMDTQFIPYGTFNNQRPGGPTQYDLQITYPLDISQKRHARARGAVGLTFSLPVFNRNQGNIARAQSNVVQTKLELSSLERRIVSEVRLAERECQGSREALEQIENSILPRAAATLRRKTEQLSAGKISADDSQGHLDDAAEVMQSHRDAIVRHSRAMLELNTAVGLRILPSIPRNTMKHVSRKTVLTLRILSNQTPRLP